jgi:hypothetical protein
MIDIAIEDGTITSDDVYKLTDLYGSNHENVMVDILSMVYQRRKDMKTLEEMQVVYREYRASLHSK